MSISRALPALLLFAALLPSCKKASDEDLVREKVRAALAAVNDKKPGGIVADAADDFVGPRNLDLKETRRYLTAYMLGAGWLRAFEVKQDVTVTGETAHVDLEAVIAKGKEIKRIEDVLPTNGSRMEFMLDLAKRDGAWMFVKADYRMKRP